MHGNTAQAPNFDVVKRMLSLQTRKRTFHCRSLFVDSLPLNGFHGRRKPLYQSFVGRVNVYDGLGEVLPCNQRDQSPSRIALVCHDVLRMKLAGDEPRFAKNVGRSAGIMDISCAYVRGNRHFRLAVNEQVKFPAECKFLLMPLCTTLDAPISFGIDLLAFVPIRPCFERGAVQSGKLTERWQTSVMLAYQFTGNVLNQVQVTPVSQTVEESAKGGLVGDSLDRVDSTDLSDKRVAFEFPNQSSRRRDTERIPNEQASPEDFDRVAFWSSANLSSESIQQGRIFEIPKESFEFSNGGRYLSNAVSGVMMGVCHEKVAAFFWLEGVSVRSTCAFAFLYWFYAQIIAKSCLEKQGV